MPYRRPFASSIVRSTRRALRRLRARSSRRAVYACAVAIALLLSINLGVRRLGGDVHALSVSRVRERALALGLLALHSLRCRAHDQEQEPTLALRRAAQRHGISPRLALAVARTESSLIHTRISGTGAMGLMQLMPDTAAELGVEDPFDTVQSADGGVRYLAQLLALYAGDTRRALAAYNAGLGRVPARGQLRLPQETRGYVGRVLSGL